LPTATLATLRTQRVTVLSLLDEARTEYLSK
jgi:hypothetical protein